MNKFRNKFESKTGEFLDEQDIKYTYETERLAYTVVGKYIPDFIITRKNGTKLYVETKGNGRSFDGASRRKLIAVKQQHPEVDLRIVFYGNGSIGPTRKDGSRMTQGEWADKHSFKWAVRNIPPEWLDE